MVAHGCVWSNSNLMSKEPADGQEQIEVDEGADEREEDLLDAYAARTLEKVAPAIIVVNISSITSVPRLAGRMPFSATEIA